MDVSVIIVNWNTKALLRDCLKSVYGQAGNVEFEVIVVDNGSTDGSYDMVRALFPKAICIANNANRGYAAGLNQGIKIAKGRYILALNSDTIICDAAIEKTVTYLDGRPEAAVVGCKVYGRQGRVQLTCFRFPSLLNLFLEAFALSRLFAKNRFFGREWMRWRLADNEQEVDVVSGMFMLVRRQAINDVGLMDEAYFLLYEEADWCYRFSKAGWKMLFWPGASIIHVGGGMQSRKKAAAKMMVQFQKSALIFFKKHYGWTEYLLARFLLAIRCATRCITWGFLKLAKQFSAKDITYEASKIRGYWWSLKFCLCGREPETGIQDTIGTSRFGMLKDTMEFICAVLYWMLFLILRREPQRVVVYYHGLVKKDVGKFEKQMDYLARLCRVVKASEITKVSHSSSKPIVALTFDDGFMSFHDNALPVLQKYRLPAAVSVPTGNLGRRPSWPLEVNCPGADEIVMDEEKLAQLDRLGVEVLSHSVSHLYLTDLDEAELEVELKQSKETLERIVGHGVSAICYPHGAYNAKVRSAAVEAGYHLGFSVEPCCVDTSGNGFGIGRFTVSPRDNMVKFKLKVRGAYQAVKYLRRLKRVFVQA